MFGNRIQILTLLGFKIYVDLSWLILAFLITWTLAVGFFPSVAPGLAAAAYWWMGIAGAFGLFASIIFHELGHSVVARRYGIPMKGITLFIFGGVAEMTKEPPSAKSEFMMAIAGPIASVFAGVFFFALYGLASALAWPLAIGLVLGYLATINIILAVFNMVPAFPLDGGRVLRAILWGIKKDLAWATRISSTLGAAFGILLMILGIVNLFNGNVIGGIWWVVLGLFIRSASKMSYQQMLLREMLEGEPVRNFMRSEPVSVPSTATLRQLVEDYIYRYHHKFFPVMDGGELSGCISLSQVKEVPSEEWGLRTVGDLTNVCSEDNTITSDSDAMNALTTMYGTGASRLLVVDQGRLQGVLALKDLMNFLALKLEVEGERQGKPHPRPRPPTIPRGSTSPAR
jgi:Zn-dependent protease/CBS domain-containing protein